MKTNIGNTIKKNPVIKTFKWALSLMKNQIVFSLILLVQGSLYLFLPSGRIEPMVIVGSVVIGLAALANVYLHLAVIDKTKLDYLLAFLNVLIALFAVFCIFKPSIVKEYVRWVVGCSMLIANFFNLIGVFKIERKKSVYFIFGVLGAVALMALGAFTIFASEKTIEEIQRPIGVVLILNALINIWYIFRMWRASRKKRRAENTAPEDGKDAVPPADSEIDAPKKESE